MFKKKAPIDIQEELNNISDEQPVVNSDVPSAPIDNGEEMFDDTIANIQSKENSEVVNSDIPSIISNNEEGFIEKVKTVFEKIWLLVKSPKTAFQEIYQDDDIGIPMGVLMVGILLVYIISMASAFMKGFESISNAGFFSEIFSGTSILILLLLAVVIIVYIVIAIIMGWATSSFSGHFFATIYGGKGKWYKYAIAILYMQLAMFIMLSPALLLYAIMLIFSTELLMIISIIYFIAAAAISIWFIVMNVIATELHYKLSKGKAIMSVLSPFIVAIIIAGLFLFIIGGIFSEFFSPFSGTSVSTPNIITYDDFDNNLNYNVNTNSTTEDDFNWNYNENTNSAINTNTNPSDYTKDSDGDGLSDITEVAYGTLIKNPDTDGDGFTDGEEVKGGFNPIGPGLYEGGWTWCIDLEGYDSCSDYCNSIDLVCSDSGTISRLSVEGWGVEAWSSAERCSSGTTGSGQLKCNDPVTYNGARWKCYCEKN